MVLTNPIRPIERRHNGMVPQVPHESLEEIDRTLDPLPP
jgi:hypothetical protein